MASTVDTDADSDLDAEGAASAQRIRGLFATIVDDRPRESKGKIWARGASEAARQSLDALQGLVYNRHVKGVGRRGALLWTRCADWSYRYKKSRREKYTDRTLRDRCYRQSTTVDKYMQRIRAPIASLRRTMVKKGANGTFFTTLPPEIRQDILAKAFGHQTIHIDLSLDHRLHSMAEADRPFHRIAGRRIQTTNSSPPHANVCEACLRFFVVNDVTPQEWTWFSCVCHRHRPEMRPPSLGRREHIPFRIEGDPDRDQCLNGTASCSEWPRNWPSTCYIGIHGWLLSCRQA